MHLKRWITGLAALPVLDIFYLPAGWFGGLLVAAGVLALREYFRILFSASGPPGQPDSGPPVISSAR